LDQAENVAAAARAVDDPVQGRVNGDLAFTRQLLDRLHEFAELLGQFGGLGMGGLGVLAHQMSPQDDFQWLVFGAEPMPNNRGAEVPNS
jgi:hypothetical protein